MLEKSAFPSAAAVFTLIALLIASMAQAAQQDSPNLPFGNDRSAMRKRISSQELNDNIFINPVTETARLRSLEDVAPDGFGISVAIDNDTIVVGGGLGSAYVFVKPPGGWTAMSPTARLTASDTEGLTGFAHTIAISGDTIVVGAYWATIGENQNQGAAYVFVKPADGWDDMNETAKLTASDGQQGDYFGTVAISGDTVVVGAFGDDIGKTKNNGSVYVFVKPESGWSTMTETAQLICSDCEFGCFFGRSVAISDDTVVAGASFDNNSTIVHQGAAYVFVKPADGWDDMSETAKLTASDGQAEDLLGQSVAISGDTVVAGTYGHDIGANQDQGAAYVFVKPAGGWSDMSETAKLTASDGAAYDALGWSVSISDTMIAAGAPYFNEMQNQNQGSIYVFVKPSEGWTDMHPTSKLMVAKGINDDDFAKCVAVSGHTVLAGDPNPSPLFATGAAYVFDLLDGGKSCPALSLYGAKAPETQLLRRYRDAVLAKSTVGGMAARLYYKLAPPAVKILEASPFLRKLTKQIINSLLPLIRRQIMQ